MPQAELTILLLNTALILIAYLSVYPTVAGSNFNKIALCDICASSVALAIVGYHYWGSDYRFNLLVTDVNWFWFTLVTYAVIEIPVMLWYFKRHHVLIKK